MPRVDPRKIPEQLALWMTSPWLQVRQLLTERVNDVPLVDLREIIITRKKVVTATSESEQINITCLYTHGFEEAIIAETAGVTRSALMSLKTILRDRDDIDSEICVASSAILYMMRMHQEPDIIWNDMIYRRMLNRIAWITRPSNDSMLGVQSASFLLECQMCLLPYK